MLCHFSLVKNEFAPEIYLQWLFLMFFFGFFSCCAGGEDSHVVQFLSGIIATFAQSIVAVPVEVIRQRQMVQTTCEGSYMVGSQL